ncbi:SusD family protein [Sphingobacterium nematocida]|uniref:SusD family protein n=1 Tax=Sphingobacterium nematocida TaxID=1513896 RepID=A0A1T5BQT3_9SPHI|nr:RagB/SusD family nutrient uptake outer membrane protein [Sphingobacterium nematocida]SKB49598.1 SusD family protein [Sphingobacterium nematocida]
MKTNFYWAALLFLMSVCSCSESWLDVKPSKSLVDASSLNDLQAVLDNSNIMNSMTGLQEVSVGDFFIENDVWKNLDLHSERNSYLWSQDIYGTEKSNLDWTKAYNRILYSNIVLEKVEAWEDKNGVTDESGNIKGQALFFRAFDFFNLAQLFCMPYGMVEYESYGLPLRLNANVNDLTNRSSVPETYSHIIADLKQSSELILTSDVDKLRPNKSAAFGMLARVFLSMRKYKDAKLYADSCISIQRELLDFNDIAFKSTGYCFSIFNKEVLFHSELSNYWSIFGDNLNVVPDLYASYSLKDLRRNLYFREVGDLVKFRGSFSGGRPLFGGIALGEVYLTRAECSARLGIPSEAIEDLGYFMQHRYTEVDIPVNLNATDLIEFVKEERRKELAFRGIRWTDIRRYNMEEAHEHIFQRRETEGVGYEIEPNSSRYMLTIPENELLINKIPQNPR